MSERRHLLRTLSLLVAVMLGGLAGGPAGAADVVLLPDVVADGIDPFWTRSVQQTLGEVLRDNDFVVLDAGVVRSVSGDLLDVCPAERRVDCVREALLILPTRVALVVTLAQGPVGPEIAVDFYDKTVAEPVQQMALPLEPGKERRVALQIAMFTLDVVADGGGTSPAMLAAARKLVTPPTITVTTEPMPAPEDELDLDDEPPPDPDGVDEEPVAPIPREPDPLPRYLVGARKGYDARKIASPSEWYRRKAPHAGRFLIELRGGFGTSDVHRAALSFVELDPSDSSTVVNQLWLEGPTGGVGGRADVYLGFAPVTMFDLGILVGSWIARDAVTVGFMAEGEEATVGAPVKFTTGRPVIQPRARLTLVPLGPAKPYLAVGMDFTFVADWKFQLTTDLPYAAPSGATVFSVAGAAGLVFDPHPQVGIQLEGMFLYHLGPASRARAVGAAPADATLPPGPVGKGYTILPTLGLQIRL